MLERCRCVWLCVWDAMIGLVAKLNQWDMFNLELMMKYWGLRQWTGGKREGENMGAVLLSLIIERKREKESNLDEMEYMRMNTFCFLLLLPGYCYPLKEVSLHANLRLYLDPDKMVSAEYSSLNIRGRPFSVSHSKTDELIFIDNVVPKQQRVILRPFHSISV